MTMRNMMQDRSSLSGMQLIHGKWASRFIWAAVIQGLIITIVTILILEPLSDFNISWYFSPSRVIAGGGAGTWMFTGYILYLVVGVIGVAVTSIFYFYIEGIQGKVYSGLANALAWGHYVFMNVGVAGSMLLMMWGGYMAGYAGTATAAGGLGYTTTEIHEKILGQLTNPIGALVLLAALGAILGGLGFIIRTRSK
ncbi:MAG: hypothetical protein JRN20_07565 [Nitrososphaerota archaeon]|nr:hypothetical protein [Nitrososphaerota archaeon]